MAFELYKKDTLRFEIEGSEIELDVSRLTATESLQMNSRISRIDPELSNIDEQGQLIEIYMDLLTTIVNDVRGIHGLDSWPEEPDARRTILNLCGFDFVFAAAISYRNSANVQEGEEGK